MNIQRNKWTYVSGLALIAMGALASQVRGIGIPASNALTYSGTLEDESGALLNGPRNIEIKLWLENGSDPLCATGSERRDVSNGRFNVPLPDKCTEAVSGNSDVFVEVIVDGAGLKPFTKLGAVPYAVESAHATTATKAAAADSAEGDLRTELDDTRQRVQGLECPDSEAQGKWGFCIWHDGNSATYTMTYLQAAALCKSKQARLCTMAEVSAAQAAGAEWCAWGWVADRIDNDNAWIAFPMQSAAGGCGGAIGVITSQQLMTATWDANCCR